MSLRPAHDPVDRPGVWSSRSSSGRLSGRRSNARVQLVTVVGEPGVGKSRMVAELLRHVDAESDLIRWRQGRCLPYGDGIAFWALGEVVKAECLFFFGLPALLAGTWLGLKLYGRVNEATFRKVVLVLLLLSGVALLV